MEAPEDATAAELAFASAAAALPEGVGVGQCAMSSFCVRGYRHGGRGGPCSLKCPPGRGGAKASARSPLTSPALRGGGRGGRGGAGGRGARGGSGGRGVSFGPGVNDGTERRMIVRRTVNSEARQAAVERQRSDASRAEIEREVRDDGVWREWHSRINGGGAATGGLCVRTCSLQRVIGYLQSVKDGSLAGDDPHFNISYIIRQVMPMHPGPSKDEAYILLQLRAATRAPHPAMGAHAKGWRAAAGSVEAAAGPADAAGVAKFPPQAPAEAGEALGCLAACVRNSRGKAVIEFRAIYVAPQLRNQRVAHVRAATPHRGPPPPRPPTPILTPRSFLRSGARSLCARRVARAVPPARVERREAREDVGGGDAAPLHADVGALLGARRLPPRPRGRQPRAEDGGAPRAAGRLRRRRRLDLARVHGAGTWPLTEAVGAWGGRGGRGYEGPPVASSGLQY